MKAHEKLYQPLLSQSWLVIIWSQIFDMLSMYLISNIRMDSMQYLFGET
jgi:hypothetical protein